MEEQGEAITPSNPMERIDNVEALAVEFETGAALYAVTVEAEAMGAIMKERDAEILTIESSHEWVGTLIDEETDMVEERESTKKVNIPSTSITELETLVP